MMHPPLPRSFKGVYPFRLAAPSFIYPDDVLPNVRCLAPFLDEIELLCFEHRPESLPSPGVIRELAGIQADTGLKFNVHLPLDLPLDAPGRGRSGEMAAVLLKVLELTRPLSPTTHTLHLPCGPAWVRPEGIPRWREQMRRLMIRLLEGGIDARELSIENLDYPLEWLHPLLAEFNLPVCVDVGHLLVCQMDVRTALDRYLGQAEIIHLHGAQGKRDHLPLTRLSPALFSSLLKRLASFEGSVSIEVFSFDNLQASLAFLAEYWFMDQQPV